MAYAANTAENVQSNFPSQTVCFPLADNTVIHKGSAVYIKDAKAYNGLADGDLFVGVCTNTVAGGYVSADSTGIFPFKISGTITASNIGSPVYVDNAKDNGTVTVTAPVSGLKSEIGVLINVENSYAFVRIDSKTYSAVETVAEAEG